MTWLVWTVIGLGLALLELVGAGLVFLCLGAAALAVGGFVAIGAHALWMQLLLFSGTSVAFVLGSRPIAHRLLHGSPGARLLTNANALPGELATVVTAIDNSRDQGQVMLHGMEWTARSLDES